MGGQVTRGALTRVGSTDFCCLTVGLSLATNLVASAALRTTA
jgi:hypothetical protein